MYTQQLTVLLPTVDCNPPHIGRLQSTVLGETRAYDIQTGQFIQILHLLGHWITVSNIACDPGHINVFDSIQSLDISSRNKQQLAAIIHTQEDKVVCTLRLPMQLQRGTNDCGLFALAYCMLLHCVLVRIQLLLAIFSTDSDNIYSTALWRR